MSKSTAASDYEGSSIPKLTEENYSEWLIDIRALLRRNKLWDSTQAEIPEAKGGQLQEAADLMTPTISSSIKKQLSEEEFNNGHLMLEKLGILLQTDDETTSDLDITELTAEALVDLKIPKDLQISPDGLQCVYSLHPASKKQEHEVSSIWIADIGSEHSARPLTSGPFKDEQPQWSPDGKHIAFVSDRAKHGESSAIYLVPNTSGEPVAITKAENKKKISNFSWNPNGKDIAFLSPDEKTAEKEAKEKRKDDAKVYAEDWEYNRLRCVDVKSGEVTTLFGEDHHVSHFAWKHDSTEIAYVVQETPDKNSAAYHGVTFARLSMTTRKTSLICNFPGPISHLCWWSKTTPETPWVPPPGFLYFLAGMSPDKANTSKVLYYVNLKAGVWRPNGWGTTNCLSDLRLSPIGTSVQILHRLEDQVAHWSLPGGLWEPLLHEHKAKVSTWDILKPIKKDPILVYATSSVNHPTEIYSSVGLKVGNERHQLSLHGGAIATLKIAKSETFHATADDGTAIDGMLFLPTGSGDKPYPTVVGLHGGPYSRINDSFDFPSYNWGPWLVAAGYAVLCPNYRGGSSHGEKFASDARGGMGRNDYANVVAILRTAVERGIVDPDRVSICGWSQGGFLSYLAVTRPDFHFRAAVCGAGVTDWDMLTMTSDLPFFEAELSGGAPWVMGAEWTKARHGSPVWHMRDVKTPVLILHGEKDEIVPVTQGIAFHRGCLHYEIPCEMVVYPREPHHVMEREHRLDMLRRIRRFLAEHMK